MVNKRMSVAVTVALALLSIALLGGCSTVTSLITSKPSANAGNDQTNALTGQAVTLDGSGSSGADSYSWALSSAPAGSARTTLDIVNKTKSIANFTPDVTGQYIFTLTVTNAAGNASSTVTITAKAAASGAPIVTVVTAATTTSSVTLAWTSVTGATFYTVYRDATLAGAGTTALTVVLSPNLTFSDSRLAAGTDYYYEVSATTPAGEGTKSAATKVTTTSVVPGINQPRAPMGFSVTASTANSLTLGWANVTGASGYRLYRSTTAGSGYNRTGSDIPATATSFQDKGTAGLAASTTYYYVITAFNASGESVNSTEASGKTLASTGAAVLPMPTNFAQAGVTVASTTNTGLWQVTLTWTVDLGAKGYYVYVNENGTTFDPSLPYYSIPGETNTSLVAGDVLPSTSNYYFITAFNADGVESPPSAALVVTTKALVVPPAPGGLAYTAGSATQTGVTLTWNAVTSTDTIEYNVYYGTQNDFSTANGLYVVSTNTVLASANPPMNLLPGTTYYFWVATYDATTGETSVPSASVSATTLPATSGTIGSVTFN